MIRLYAAAATAAIVGVVVAAWRALWRLWSDFDEEMFE